MKPEKSNRIGINTLLDRENRNLRIIEPAKLKADWYKSCYDQIDAKPTGSPLTRLYKLALSHEGSGYSLTVVRG